MCTITKTILIKARIKSLLQLSKALEINSNPCKYFSARGYFLCLLSVRLEDKCLISVDLKLSGNLQETHAHYTQLTLFILESTFPKTLYHRSGE